MPAGVNRPGVEQVAGRYTVHSVARALRLVDLVAAGPPDGRSLTDLATELGTSKSTALSLARTLAAFGYLRDVGQGRGYALGTALIRLGDIAGQQLPLRDLCRPLIEELSEATKLTARVAVNDDSYPVFIDRVDGPGSVRFHTPLGQREVPYASAAGKAMLAATDEATVRRICAETGLAPRTAHTITDAGTLLENLVAVRRRGFAVDDEEDAEGAEGAEGVFCIGAGFYGHGGACTGAVSVTGIKGDLPAWRMDEIGRVVARCAAQISTLLGGQPPVPP